MTHPGQLIDPDARWVCEDPELPLRTPQRREGHPDCRDCVMVVYANLVRFGDALVSSRYYVDEAETEFSERYKDTLKHWYESCRQQHGLPVLGGATSMNR